MAGRVSIGFKTSPQNVDWLTIDATWARAGELGVFDSAWLNDHITNPAVERGGPSWESLTLLDHQTGGRFVLGLGAGWHEGEHLPFGIPLPPIQERFDRFESAVGVIRALFSDEAAHEPGVVRADPFYPLDGATNLPPPLTPGGPPMWLGGQKKRGLALVAREGNGWMLPAIPRFDYDYFADKHDRILADLAAIGRDPAGFAFAAQLPTGATAEERAAAVEAGVRFAEIGATHVILGMPAGLGPAGIETVAAEIAVPLRERLG